MAVSYIAAGASITAARMNSLFERLEAALEAACDGKSIFCLGGMELAESAGLLGKLFCFTNGTRIWAPSSPANYNHATYTAIVAAATEVSQDDTKLILTCSGLGDGLTPSYLDDSLEAHTREPASVPGTPYYLIATTHNIPEKKYRYAVAELLYEGAGYETVTFPEDYTKYNFFRIHNLNAYEMEFTFEGGGPTITIPPWSQKAVRRTAVDGSYNYDWKYCFKFLPNDPRFICSMAEFGLHLHQSANNVTNPRVIFDWLNEMARRRELGKVGTWYVDPHEVWDMQALYVPTYFPDPATTTLIFGNFLHHKGKFVSDSIEYDFTGYESLPAVLNATPGASALSIDPDDPIQALTTNLFGALTLGAGPSDLATVNTGVGNLVLIAADVDADDIENHAGGTMVSIDREVLSSVATTTSDLHIWEDTVDDVLTLNAFGNAAYAGTDQDTNATTISARALVLTPFGPRLQFVEQIDLIGSCVNVPELFDDPTHYAGGGYLQLNRFIQFSGYGFPEPSFDIVGDPGNTRPIYESTAFLTPRVNWAASTVTGEHPNITDAIEGTNGSDFGLSPVPDNYAEVLEGGENIAMMAAPELVTAGIFRVWSVAGVGGMPRVPLLVEHYNAMAAALNSIVMVRPLDFTALRIPWGSSYVTIPPNTVGIFGSQIAPLEMYRSFDMSDPAQEDIHDVCVALGIPILDETDLPASYATAAAETCDVHRQTYKMRGTVLSRVGTVHTFEHEFDSVAVTTIGSGASVSGADFEDVHGLNPTNTEHDFRWVSIADIKDAADALGWKFCYTQVFQRMGLEVFAVPDPTELYAPTGGTTTFDKDMAPNTYANGTEFFFEYTHDFPTKLAAFVNDATGEWKEAVTTALAVDITPGDIHLVGYPDVRFGTTAYYEHGGLDDNLRLAMGLGHPDLMDLRRYVVAQNYFSAGFTNTSIAFKVPITGPAHVSDDYSAISLANATDRIEPSYAEGLPGLGSTTDRKKQIPVQERGRTGTIATSVDLPAGDTTIAFTAGEYLEVIPYWRTVVVV